MVFFLRRGAKKAKHNRELRREKKFAEYLMMLTSALKVLSKK
jgi:hypothetical protein